MYMPTRTITERLQAIIITAAAAALFTPVLMHAQATAPSDLSATIRAAILHDPRSASLSPAQIGAMVSALSSKAQTQGITAQDIAYRPGTAGIAVQTTNASNAASPCSLSSWCAVGDFLGSGLARNAVYAAFWILSIILIIVVWHMRKNPHLAGMQDVRDTPAIGGGI
jgi:preprotein translocase subunit SecF